jgi:Tol biopolymer transport system component
VKVRKCCSALAWAVLFLSFIARTGMADDPASAPTATDEKSELIEPLFVRPLVKIETGRNDSNPVWSPHGAFIAFERSIGDKKEIRITLPEGTLIQTVYFKLSDGDKEMKFFFPGVSDETSYNAGITWSPDQFRFVYMSNGGEGNYDIYLQDLGGDVPVRLTDHKEKDGQAHWSPTADRLVLVSGLTGNGDIYLLYLNKR